MNAKGLFLLFGGMSLSFVLVLGIMLSTINSGKSRSKPRRIITTEKVPTHTQSGDIRPPAPHGQQKQCNNAHAAQAECTPKTTNLQRERTNLAAAAERTTPSR